MRAHILDCARRLHRSHARSDLVQLESLPEQSHSFLPDLENPLFAEWRASARCAKHIHAPAIVVRICRDAVAGAHRVLRGFVDGLADLDDVVEDGGIDQARRGHGVVLVGQRRQYLGRQLEPWSMKRGDVAPVPVVIVRVMVVSLSSRALGAPWVLLERLEGLRKRKHCTYLLVPADDEARAGGLLGRRGGLLFGHCAGQLPYSAGCGTKEATI